MLRNKLLLLALLAISTQVIAGPKTLPMRERAAVIDAWLDTRIQTVLPALMRRADIDMWIIISREYNEDPVIRTFLPSKWQAARRTTILMIHDPGGDKELETELAAAHNRLGRIYAATGERQKALAAFQKGIGILERLARENPTTTKYLSNFAANYSNMGLLYRETGEPS